MFEFLFFHTVGKVYSLEDLGERFEIKLTSLERIWAEKVWHYYVFIE